MAEEDVSFPDLMKQLLAVQGSLERSSRIMLRNHLENCVAAAMVAGRTDEIVDELMEARRYDRITAGLLPEPAGESGRWPPLRWTGSGPPERSWWCRA